MLSMLCLQRPKGSLIDQSLSVVFTDCCLPINPSKGEVKITGKCAIKMCSRELWKGQLYDEAKMLEDLSREEYVVTIVSN